MKRKSLIGKDGLWKGLLEDFFEDLLLCFYPTWMLHREVKRILFLDKELDEIIPAEHQSLRYADKLANVEFQQGEIKILFIHVEVQGYKDPDFNHRMFDYQIRLYSKYKQPIESLVIFSHPMADVPSFNYSQKAIHTSIQLRYHGFRLWEANNKELLHSGSPFSLALLAAKEAIMMEKSSEDQKLAYQIKYARMLYQKGLSTGNHPKIT